MKLDGLGAVNQHSTTLRPTTVRDFDGGWNITDNELNLSAKYARVLDNMERGTDGTLSVRKGTKFFCKFTVDSSAIINMHYFNNKLVVVQYSGRVSLVDAAGAIAHLPLSSTGVNAWTPGVTFVSFTLMNNDLIIANGRDKPLIISGNVTLPNGTANPLYMKLAYLVDMATLSNINTPIGRYVIAHGQYVVVAGMANKPATISISSRNTSGTFKDDPAPNDAIELDLGPRVSRGSSTITGLVSYRDKLLVAFENGVLPLNLGVYNSSVHTPSDDGFIEEYGSLAHRAMVNIGDDTYYCDNIGVDTITRSSFTNALKPARASELIDPAITASLKALTSEQIADYVFAVYDLHNKRYMLFVPTFVNGVITETVCYSYTDRQTAKVKAWARLRGWNWSCGCRTARQSLMFAHKNKIYTYNQEATTTALDFLNDVDINNGGGIPINFDWEMPWADFGKRLNTKVSHFISLDTTGEGTFNVSMYADRKRTDADGNDAPDLTMAFVGDMPNGYGDIGYGTGAYGSGRVAGDERLYEWPCTFHIAKVRIHGATSKPLSITSVSILYALGAFGR